jgi:hypothetical protein
MAGARGELWTTDPWAAEARPRRRSLGEVVAAPPGLTFNVWVGLACALLLVVTATPGWIALPFLGLCALLSFLGVIWLVRLVLGLASGARAGRSMRLFLLAPAMVAATGVLVALDVPVRVGFAISRADLQAAADELVAPEPVHPEMPLGAATLDAIAHEPIEGRFGVYSITRSRLFRNGLVLFESNGAFFDDAGFAYFPDGNLPLGDGSFESPDFRALGGGWYAFTSSW